MSEGVEQHIGSTVVPQRDREKTLLGGIWGACRDVQKGFLKMIVELCIMRYEF